MKQRREKTLAEIKEQVSVSIPEASKITGHCWKTLDEMMQSGDILWFRKGSRRRIVTKSIFEYQDRKVAESMDKAS